MPGPQLRGSNPFTGKHTTPPPGRAYPAPTVRQKKRLLHKEKIQVQQPLYG